MLLNRLYLKKKIRYFIFFMKLFLTSIKNIFKKNYLKHSPDLLFFSRPSKHIFYNEKGEFYFSNKKKFFVIVNDLDKNCHLSKKYSVSSFISFSFFIFAFFLMFTKKTKNLCKKMNTYNNPYFVSLYYQIYSNVVKFYNPKILLSTISYGHTKILLYICKEREKIKFIELQHGSIVKDHFYYCTNNFNIFPDYFISYGQYEKEILPDKLNVMPLGSLRHDHLKNYKPSTNIIKKYNIVQKNILFFATQTHDITMQGLGENKKNINSISSVIKKKKNWHLLIKLHPNEDQVKNKKYYENFLSSKGLSSRRYTILEYYKESTFDCIYYSNAVIIKQSTVGLEAILLEKPVINLALKNSLSLNIYKELNSFLCVKNKKDLVQYLDLVLSKKYMEFFKKERIQFINHHFNNFGFSKKKILCFLKGVNKCIKRKKSRQ